MKLEIDLKLFALAVFYFVLAVALTSGRVQELIKFNSIDSEIALFILCGSAGMLSLIASLKARR
jgi:hypothetical protein